AGLKIEADLSRPAGNRVLSIMVGDTPLDDNKTYSVATSDFMARGGDDYVAFRDANPVLPPADSPTVAYEVIDYIKSIGTIRTGVAGWIVLKRAGIPLTNPRSRTGPTTPFRFRLSSSWMFGATSAAALTERAAASRSLTQR